ncbi:hypothetical protein HK097_001750 [Rhizophlyctis rosea]|uniref:Uncharacterized protein n=1 Tax=Rhizophlyctis rosea TaxID=64517 RepID=A0AAD5SC06_9FUNG|nr:hypothetical protein HK097_001750 [Rhizophlyctis rosea]
MFTELIGRLCVVTTKTVEKAKREEEGSVARIQVVRRTDGHVAKHSRGLLLVPTLEGLLKGERSLVTGSSPNLCWHYRHSETKEFATRYETAEARQSAGLPDFHSLDLQLATHSSSSVFNSIMAICRNFICEGSDFRRLEVGCRR